MGRLGRYSFVKIRFVVGYMSRICGFGLDGETREVLVGGWYFSSGIGWGFGRLV